jgi:hypothetical protein
MTLQLTLPPELEERLRKEAEREGLSPDAITLKLLDKHLPPVDRRGAIALLQQWTAEDEAMTEEESMANRAVLQAIDEDRLSDRKLFTDILKDESV